MQIETNRVFIPYEKEEITFKERLLTPSRDFSDSAVFFVLILAFLMFIEIFFLIGRLSLLAWIGIAFANMVVTTVITALIVGTMYDRTKVVKVKKEPAKTKIKIKFTVDKNISKKITEQVKSEEALLAN